MPVILQAETNPGVANWVESAGRVVHTLSTTAGQQILNIVDFQAAYPVDGILLASVRTDDTGGTLGGIAYARVTSPNQITIAFNNPPTANDGVVTAVLIAPE